MTCNNISPALLIWFQSEYLNLVVNVILDMEGSEPAKDF